MQAGKDYFAGLDSDPLAEVLDQAAAGAAPREARPPESYQPKTFEEPCPKCRGSGRFITYSGRTGGPCFACKGAGKKVFKTSAADRAKKRQASADKKAEKIEAFKAEHPDVWAWLDGSTFPPAQQMLADLIKFGSLFDSRIEFAKRMIAKRDEARAAAQAAKDERIASAAPVNVSALEKAFSAAASRNKRAALWIGPVRIKPARGKPGVLYVNRPDTDQYLGKIESGKFTPSRECAARSGLMAEILAILADPKGKAIEHGKLTGACAVCSRTLTDADSIAAGIGPVCATKMGW